MIINEDTKEFEYGGAGCPSTDCIRYRLMIKENRLDRLEKDFDVKEFIAAYIL